MSERTLILIKPDGVQRQLVGRIIERYEQRGLRIVGLKLLQVDRALAERHYAVHADKPFFPGLVAFITSSPLVAMAVEGTDAVTVCRALNGATPSERGGPRLHPWRLRAGDGHEPRACLGQPGERGRGAGTLVRRR